MRIWNWLKGKRSKETLDPRITRAFSRVKRDIKELKTDLTDTNVQLGEQNNRIAKNTELINGHAMRLEKLEDIVAAASTWPSAQNSPTSRLSQPTSRLVATRQRQAESLSRLDMGSLTEQEKRILGAFLDHRDMSLSYQDIAKSLGKSASTVKNQMRQMNMKADLFDRTVDSEKKTRFRLKKALKVEAELDTD